MGQMIESLEGRRMLAVNMAQTLTLTSTAQFNYATTQALTSWSSEQFHITKRGTLVIKGTDGADELAVVKQGNNVSLWTNSDNPLLVVTFTDGSIKRLLVEAGGGDDVINVAGFDRSATVAGGAGDDRMWCGRGHQLIGGGGNDLLVTGGSYNLPEIGNDTGIGELVDARPSLVSGGAGRDTLVAAARAPDSLVGGTGSDRLFCTAEFEGTAPTGEAAEDLLVEQDDATLSGFETIVMSQRKAMVTRPEGFPDFNSPFGIFGTVAGGQTGWVRLSRG